MAAPFSFQIYFQAERWFIGTHVKDVSAEEIQKSANEMFKGAA